MERLTGGGDLELPWHIARKKLKCIDAEGEVHERPGVKFETFIFDALGQTSSSVVLEVLREAEFSPVKNATGSDSPASCRADLGRIGAALSGLGGGAVELDPRLAETPEEFAAAAPTAVQLEAGTVFRPAGS